MSRGARLARAGLAAALLVAAGPADAGIEAFAGTWIRTQLARDDAARDAEIERVTEAMLPGIRGIARTVMRLRMRPPESYTIAATRHGWSVRTDAGDEYAVGGEARADGEEEVTTRYADGEIRQAWRHGPNSHGTTVWRTEGAGDELVVRIVVHDSRFDDAIRYATRYRRSPPRPGGSP